MEAHLQRRKWALITNAVPGSLGEAQAAAFLKRGINVLSASPNTKNIGYLQPRKGTDDGFTVTLRLDVTSREAIRAAVKTAEELTDGRGVDWLVNNSHGRGDGGRGCGFGALLDVDVGMAKKDYDADVWGILRVTQAFFPMVRKARGCVVNVSNVAGVQGYSRPFLGVRSSSRAAIISLSATMRVEFQPFGVKVVTVVGEEEKVDIFKSREWVPDYSIYFPLKEVEQEPKAKEGIEEDKKDSGYFEVAQRTIDELLREPTPVYVGRSWLTGIIMFLYWLYPTWILDQQVLQTSGLDRLKKRISEDARDKKDQ